uniref:Uncharacterized protein n=1 Tax=Globodera rostochiensis TaxID=31243 RepID=A0A914HWR6_GLORO
MPLHFHSVKSLLFLFLIAFSALTALAEDSVVGDGLIPAMEEQEDAILSAEKRVPHPFGWRQPGTARLRSSFHPTAMMPAEFGGRRFNRFYDYTAPGRPLFVRYMRNFAN